MLYKITNSVVVDTHLLLFKNFLIELQFYQLKYFNSSFVIEVDTNLVYIKTPLLLITLGHRDRLVDVDLRTAFELYLNNKYSD